MAVLRAWHALVADARHVMQTVAQRKDVEAGNLRHGPACDVAWPRVKSFTESCHRVVKAEAAEAILDHSGAPGVPETTCFAATGWPTDAAAATSDPSCLERALWPNICKA